MKTSTFVRLLSSLAAVTAIVAAPPAFAANVYQATWSSVDTHNPAPEWFKDAKFGIYFHWGVFSVPAYGSEWYPRNMYNQGSGEYNHHVATYGDPYSSWPYHNFINGANDKGGRWTQFAPKLASAGGAFDPNAWAQLFVDSGAKFAGQVAEHHDGFSMWNSRVNEWNSVSKGPKLDLAALFAAAIKAKGLKFFMSSHNAYNFTGYYQWVPKQSDASLQKLYGQLPSATEYQLWVDKLKELIDGYQPDIMYHDFNVNLIPESYRLQYLAYYYNAAVDWNKEVIVVYKDGSFNQRGELLDYERGGPAGLTSYYWLTDDAISSSTWGYTTGMRYYSTAALLHAMIDRVSKNGNMILNISPMADGSIPQAQKDILLGIGDWLKKYGEAIYSTRAWTTYGEGPTKLGGGTLIQPTQATAQDIRYTRSKDNTVLYAMVLGWPGNGATVKLASLSSGVINLGNLTSVQLITGPGAYTAVSYRQDSTGLNVTMPASQPFSALAYAIRLTFNGQIGSGGGSSYSLTVSRTGTGSGTVISSTGGINCGSACSATLLSGTAVTLTAAASAGSTFNGWSGACTGTGTCIVTMTAARSVTATFTGTGGGTFDPNAYYKIVNQADGKVIDSGGATTDGSYAKLWTDVSNSNQRWQLVDMGGGYYKIKNQADGKVLDSGGATTDGSYCKLWSDVSSPNLRWQLVDMGGGYYKIVNQADGKVLDSGGATTDGSYVKLWSDVSSPNLRWQIIRTN